MERLLSNLEESYGSSKQLSFEAALETHASQIDTQDTSKFEEPEPAQVVSLESLAQLSRMHACLNVLKSEKARLLKARNKSILILTIIFVSLLAIENITKHPLTSFSTLFFTIIISFFFVYGSNSFQRQKKATLELSQFYDPSLVGPLAEQMSVLREAELFEIRQTLTRLLLNFNASDSTLLDKNQRLRLLEQLKILNYVRYESGMVEFRLAIIKAMSQVGSHESLSFIEAVAEGRESGKHHPPLVQAAQEALPVLQARIANLKESEILLRATMPECVPFNELLRSASGVKEIDVDNLLRPSHLPQKDD